MVMNFLAFLFNFFHADLTQHQVKTRDFEMGLIFGIMLRTEMRNKKVLSIQDGVQYWSYLSSFEAGVQKTSQLFAGGLNSQSFPSSAWAEFSLESNTHETHIHILQDSSHIMQVPVVQVRNGWSLFVLGGGL